MSRCHIAGLPQALAASLLCVAPLIASSQSLPRSFNAQTLRGVMEVRLAPEVLLNGKPALLSPGARIRGTENMLVLSAQLSGQRLVVNYTLDNQGQLRDVWVLTPAEIAKQPWPTTLEQAQQWVYDPLSQSWLKP
jgi:hypothetical protein